MKVLSIDWDYFVKEDPMLDWGHRENGLFLDAIWHTRRSRPVRDLSHPSKLLIDEHGLAVMEKIDLTTVVPFVGDEAFLIAAALRWSSYDIAANESHYGILQAIEHERDLEIINVDAHHDIWYHGEPDKREDVECGSWAGWLMQRGQVRSYHQVYPTWRRDHPEGNLPAAWARKRCRLKVTYGELRIPWKTVDLIFICRSGCWTPPEYDRRFNNFISAMGLDSEFPVRGT